MKDYPSIPRWQDAKTIIGARCYAWTKIDGSNLRFEFAKDKWNKFGTRNRLFDQSHQIFGSAIDMFRSSWQEDITEVFRQEKIREATVFMEFWGDYSFGGLHLPGDEMRLTMFDVWIPKKGLMPSKEFKDLFYHLPTPQIYFVGDYDDYLINSVRDANLMEGVVVKGGGSLRDQWMVKVKTDRYLFMLKNFGVLRKILNNGSFSMVDIQVFEDKINSMDADYIEMLNRLANCSQDEMLEIEQDYPAEVQTMRIFRGMPDAKFGEEES